MADTSAVSSVLDVTSYKERCGEHLNSCVAGFGIGVLLVLLLILVYYFFFSRSERMVNLANAYNNPGAQQLAASFASADPSVSSLSAARRERMWFSNPLAAPAVSTAAPAPRVQRPKGSRERMSENTSDRMAAYLWS